MKKVLFIGLLLGLGYYAYSKSKTTPSETEETENEEDFFVKYDGRMVEDQDGFTMLVQKGKIYVHKDDATYFKWFADNPNKPQIKVDLPLWKTYANKPETYGGTF